MGLASAFEKLERFFDRVFSWGEKDPAFEGDKSSSDTPEVLNDTAAMMLETGEMPAFKDAPQKSINDSDYWWCFPGWPSTDTPVFEGIDDEAVTKDLNRRIDEEQFPVIEIPTTVMKTMQILNNPDFDYAEVSNLINRSPAMAGEFIKIINSSLYNRGVAIGDLKVALPRMGRDSIKAMLYMYASKMSFANSPLFNDLAVKIVDHSYATALVSSYLSQRFYPDPDGAFLAGLLHDIGKLGILKAMSDLYVLPREVNFELTEEVFDNIFPALHEKAGCFLALNWKIDKTVIEAISHHHDFSDYGFGEDDQLSLHLSELVNLSDTIVRILGKGRRIGPVNIFAEPATIDLAMEKDFNTVKFLEDIPRIVAFKASSAAVA
ncbi:MAG: hypothetical protein A2X49_07555 [Lentisphaerae bacterium GWF2_52_8]|nr:MAG: hypothetical protein A2X49_07555 [Lentisphaerae bacterium GWF2_52_8]